jgi:hypothetical protein
MKMLNRGARSVKPPGPAVCHVMPQVSSTGDAAAPSYERPVTILHALPAADDEQPPVAVQVVVNSIQGPPAFVSARNSEAVVGLAPRPFRAALKASQLPFTRVRGIGAVVEREAFVRWLASQAKPPTRKTGAPLDAVDVALELAGFKRAR